MSVEQFEIVGIPREIYGFDRIVVHNTSPRSLALYRGQSMVSQAAARELVRKASKMPEFRALLPDREI